MANSVDLNQSSLLRVIWSGLIYLFMHFCLKFYELNGISKIYYPRNSSLLSRYYFFELIQLCWVSLMTTTTIDECLALWVKFSADDSKTPFTPYFLYFFFFFFFFFCNKPSPFSLIIFKKKKKKKKKKNKNKKHYKKTKKTKKKTYLHSFIRRQNCFEK